MGNQIPVIQSFNLPDGQEIIIETGKLATQADGSVVIKQGNTMVFAAVVFAKKAKEGQAFFPLSVDYQEKFAAAGRIPGNFFRRETKLSDYEVLISRLVDRAIRPLFPDNYMNETQVIINLISADKETMPDALVALAASAALTLSDIPFEGPISEVRVARIDGEYKVNPKRSELKNADLDIIVGATKDNVTMVEGQAKECSEADLVSAIKIGHEAIKVQIEAQLALAQKVGGKALLRREVEPVAVDEELYDLVSNTTKSQIYEVAKGALAKQDRKEKFDTIKEALLAGLLEEKGEEWLGEHKSSVETYFDKLKKNVVRTMMLEEKTRLDGRQLNEIRPIWTEIDYLPSTHGSAIFNRGETQALTSLTLGTKLDESMFDTAIELSFEKFLLHYNFPGYSVGEVKPQRAPARREVGHANLAGRSLRQVLPENFPYTIRLVSDILESNGSSSMATVCAGSLALMDGGVPIKAAVSGIAMGLVTENGKFAILSDILGDEDALGDMDFKVTGTEKGITGCQMDIKIDGLPYEVMENALDQAREGRLHILNKMAETIAEPREDLKPHAPRIEVIVIEKSFIGAVIGPGGSIIQKIQEDTGTVITIEEKEGKGFVNISSSDKVSIDKAITRVKQITYAPEIGDEFDGIIEEIMPFGAIVNINGKTGLMHVSEISYTRVENVEDVLKVGDAIKVKIIDVDRKTGKFKLSAKALLPKPEGYVERPPRTDRPRDDRRGGDRRDDRRGGGGYGRDDRRGGGDRDRNDRRDKN